MEIALLTDADYRKAVGCRLRALIDALGITYVEAAEDMGVSKNHLGNWMRGHAYPMHYALYRFCRIRGVNTDFIYLDDPSGLPGRVLKLLLEPGPLPVDQEVAEKPKIESSARRRAPARAG